MEYFTKFKNLAIIHLTVGTLFFVVFIYDVAYSDAITSLLYFLVSQLNYMFFVVYLVTYLILKNK